jgi:multiple antibiotic resistance protein
MTFTELAVLLFLVSDPFGNIPLVLATLRSLPEREYRRAVTRETVAAFLILALFAWSGEAIINRFGIAQASLHVAGGIVLFIISLRMIFPGRKDAVDEGYQEDPWFVPIAMPAIAGPAAITTVIVVKNQPFVGLVQVLGALAVVFLLSLAIFIYGRRVADWLKPTGMRALERLTGMLLCLLAVNMTLYGIRMYFSDGGA